MQRNTESNVCRWYRAHRSPVQFPEAGYKTYNQNMDMSNASIPLVHLKKSNHTESKSSFPILSRKVLMHLSFVLML